MTVGKVARAARKKESGKVSQEQRDEIQKLYRHALAAGDDDKALAIAKRMPVPPRFANVFKEAFGAQWLLDQGFDLSDAVAYYGEGWLHEPGKYR